MKKVMIFMLLVLASVTTFAQQQDNNATPEQRAERQTKRLTDGLKLTEDQQKQVYALNLDRAKEMEAIRSAGPDREKMKASMEKFNTDLAKVLTPEQQEKYKEMAAEMRNRGGGGGGGRPQN